MTASSAAKNRTESYGSDVGRPFCPECDLGVNTCTCELEPWVPQDDEGAKTVDELLGQGTAHGDRSGT